MGIYQQIQQQFSITRGNGKTRSSICMSVHQFFIFSVYCLLDCLSSKRFQEKMHKCFFQKAASQHILSCLQNEQCKRTCICSKVTPCAVVMGSIWISKLAFSTAATLWDTGCLRIDCGNAIYQCRFVWKSMRKQLFNPPSDTLCLINIQHYPAFKLRRPIKKLVTFAWASRYIERYRNVGCTPASHCNATRSNALECFVFRDETETDLKMACSALLPLKTCCPFCQDTQRFVLCTYNKHWSASTESFSGTSETNPIFSMASSLKTCKNIGAVRSYIFTCKNTTNQLNYVWSYISVIWPEVNSGTVQYSHLNFPYNMLFTFDITHRVLTIFKAITQPCKIWKATW